MCPDCFIADAWSPAIIGLCRRMLKMSSLAPAQGMPSLSKGKTVLLAIGALGVVYGDIGTSPLYAIKECFHGIHAIALTERNIFGVASLVAWSLIIVVSVKYVGFIMRADNRGEGGIFALLALVSGARDQISQRVQSKVAFAALLGAALLYGDGMITPSISVLSAIEGLNVATHAAEKMVVPITCAILFGLFSIQSRGTEDIGFIFGPIMMVWFIVIAALGLRYIIEEPHILAALNPIYGYKFFVTNRLHGFIVLGAVVLCITGGEALYADLGHFGRKVIQLSWNSIVLPSLLFSYFGQAALLLKHPEMASNPFYGLAPSFLLYPMVGLATAATVIASQAMISGAFSLTRQAVQLGYCPRVSIVHTSSKIEGQIYIPEVNHLMMIACIGLVLAFRESSRLAAAYGVAVTANMAITSVIFFFLITHIWHWPLWKAAPLVGLFLVFDLAYLISNLLKIVDGGWFPIAVAFAIVTVMITWKDGRAELYRRVVVPRIPLELLIEDLARHNYPRIPGTTVFMASATRIAPPVLMHHLKHNQVLHKEVVILTIQSAEVPSVPAGEKLTVKDLGQGFYQLVARYGFMETPNVPNIMRRAHRLGLIHDPNPRTYYLSRETILTTGNSRMMRWRKKLFAFLSRNARPATDYFRLPPGHVIELGIQIEL
jgi:KUP system potassium uptake protein